MFVQGFLVLRTQLEASWATPRVRSELLDIFYSLLNLGVSAILYFRSAICCDASAYKGQYHSGRRNQNEFANFVYSNRWVVAKDEWQNCKRDIRG